MAYWLTVEDLKRQAEKDAAMARLKQRQNWVKMRSRY